jgi:hypothetical protein
LPANDNPTVWCGALAHAGYGITRIEQAKKQFPCICTLQRSVPFLNPLPYKSLFAVWNGGKKFNSL